MCGRFGPALDAGFFIVLAHFENGLNVLPGAGRSSLTGRNDL
jgi:hypothetical protein